MLKLFFSPGNTETAAGMFTPHHLIFLTLCLIFVGIAVYFSHNLSEKSITKIIRIFAIVFTAMEIIKIILLELVIDTIMRQVLLLLLIWMI